MIFFSFFARQLSINSFILLSSFELTNLFISLFVIFFLFFANISIFSNSFKRNFLSQLVLLTIKLIVSKETEIFFFLKKLLVKLTSD